MSTTADARLIPMLASVGDEIPRGPGWPFEPKYDGIRVIAHARPTSVSLLTRNGIDKAVHRDRTVSYPDSVYGTHGDAAFAQYVWLASITRRF